MTNGSDALWEGNQLQTLCSPTSKGHPAGFKQPKEKGEENTVKHYFFSPHLNFAISYAF